MFLFASCEITRGILKPTVQKHQGRIVIAPAAQQNCRNPTGRKTTEDQRISQHLAVKIRGDIILSISIFVFNLNLCPTIPAPPAPSLAGRNKTRAAGRLPPQIFDLSRQFFHDHSGRTRSGCPHLVTGYRLKRTMFSKITSQFRTNFSVNLALQS
jgi:hypothetical protein